MYTTSSAFDAVDYNFVCNKLCNLGIRGPVNNFSSRFFKVEEQLLKFSESVKMNNGKTPIVVFAVNRDTLITKMETVIKDTTKLIII